MSYYEKLDDGGMLPPEVARAFAPIRLEHEKALAKMGLSPNRSMTEQQQKALEPTMSEGDGLRLAWRSSDEELAPSARTVLIEYGKANGGVFSRQEAEEVLGVGRDVTLKVINGMIEDGDVIKEGKARATRYRVARA